MNELQIVKKLNGQSGKCARADRAIGGIARFGPLVFVLYGLWLWFGGRREDRIARRTAALTALGGVALCSLLSFAIGKLWRRPRPFVRDNAVRNFTNHAANAAFPSNHTMNGAVVSAVMIRLGMPGGKLLAALTALMGGARIFAGIHYPSDIAGGAAIALLVDALVLAGAPFRRAASALAAASVLAERLWRHFRALR